MAQSLLTINLQSIAENWRRLDRKSAPSVETGAVLKADSYGLGAMIVAPFLVNSGVKTFFVALAEEGMELRKLVPENIRIFILSGYMVGDKPLLEKYDLIPVLVSREQFSRYSVELSHHKFGIQLDSGMNRLGMEPGHFLDLRIKSSPWVLKLIISHLSCAEEKNHSMNMTQLHNFRELTNGIETPLSLAATGGILLGNDFHFDLCRPGIGLFGGFPFEDAIPVLSLKIPVIQVQHVKKGEGVGYNMAWVASKDTRLATVAAGYADGLIRSLSNNAIVYANNIPCPVVGRVSMDLVTVDVSGLQEIPDYLEFLGVNQRIDDLANQASTIGHEVLTSLGRRYKRNYVC